MREPCRNCGNAIMTEKETQEAYARSQRCIDEAEKAAQRAWMRCEDTWRALPKDATKEMKNMVEDALRTAEDLCEKADLIARRGGLEMKTLASELLRLEGKDPADEERIKKAHKLIEEYADAYMEKVDRLCDVKNGDLPILLFELDIYADAIRDTVDSDPALSLIYKAIKIAMQK